VKIKARFLVVVGLAAAVIVACGSVAEELERASQEVTPTATSAASTPGRSEQPQGQARQTPTSERKIEVSGAGFAQSDRLIYYAFIVVNRNEREAAERTSYQVAFLDDTGRVVARDSGYITFLFPGETQGVAGNASVGEGVRPARIQVQVSSPSAWTELNVKSKLTAEVQSVAPQRFLGPKVSGVVNNPFTVELKQIRVSIVAYDAAGNIIGGEFTYVDFVPAGGQAPFEETLWQGAQPAKVEAYAAISGLTALDLQQRR